MSKKAHAVAIDGEKYLIERVDPFDGFRLSTICARSLGPLVSSVATSPNLSSLAKSIVKGSKQDDPKGVSGLEALLDQDLLAVASVLGVTLEQVAESMGEEDLVRVVLLAVVGHVSTPVNDASMMKIEDEQTFSDVLGPRVAKHSILHQFKLLWEVLRFNLGPTTAADPTSLREESAAQR